MKQSRILISLLLVSLLIVPSVSATYYKKATIETFDEEWEIEENDQYQTVTGNNMNYLVITFEDTGLWIMKKGATFVVTPKELTYITGWWIWKQTGTIEKVDVEENNLTEAIYDDYYLWHIKLFDKYHIQFFYINFKEDFDMSINVTENVTINYMLFGGGDTVVGCMYEANTPIVTVREAGWMDMMKYGGTLS